MASQQQADERFWRQAVHRFSRRIHFGWWLDAFLHLLIPIALVAAVMILALRWSTVLPMRTALGSLAATTLLIGLAAFWRMRKQREPLAATQVRLEDAFHLHTRLSAAAAGVGDWPPTRENLRLPVTFRPNRALAMAAFCVAMVIAALHIPISSTTPAPTRMIEPPSALQEVQTWLDNIKKEEAASQESVDEIEQKMAELLQRPAQNWYEHASLEAADHLRELTAQDLQQFAQNLADAERTANALAAAAAGAGLPQAAKDALSQQLQQAAQSMQSGSLQPNSDLAEALKGLDSDQLAGLSPDQLKQLSNQIGQNAKALQEALSNSPSLDFSNLPTGRSKEGTGEGEEGKGPGRGGINRGPGTAPVTLDAEATALNSTQIEMLKRPLDLQRIATGDALSITDGAAKIDPQSYQGTQQSGAAASPGDGGNAVWQNTLLPAERETLKRFFK